MEIFPARAPSEAAASDGGQVELSLELSLGLCGASKPAVVVAVPGQEPPKGFSFVDLTGVSGEGRAEMEARMVEGRASDRLAREEQEEVCSGDRRRYGGAGAGKMAYVVHPQPFPAMIPYHHHQVQYVPVPVPVTAGGYGYGFPYVMPYWAPANVAATAVGAETCSPAAYRGFPVPMPVGGRVGVTEMRGYGKAVGIDGGFSLPVDSPGSSASGVSDHRSSRIHGGSISSSSESADPQSTPPQSSQLIAEEAGGADKSARPALDEQPALAAAIAPAKLVALPAARPAPPVPKSLQAPAAAKTAATEKKKTTSVVSPPRVAATGDGPNGRTVAGFLHKYTRSEVMIVCVCHGAFFTPADFMRHAGCTDISQPLKQIVMLDA